VRRYITLIMPLVALLVFTGTQFASAQSGTGMERVPGVMSGTITDEGGAALSGINVKIFEEGLLLAEAVSGADGNYYLEFEFIPDIDWTLLTWFVPEEGDLLPNIIILRESLRSKDLGLWSPCLQRHELKARMRFDTVLLTDDTTLKQMSELECLEDD